MARLLFISLMLISTFYLGACNDGDQETTEEEVLETFDRNSPRPPGEEEYQEDSAFVTGTPIETEDN